MVRIQQAQALKPVLTSDDWQLIMSAISAYSHNNRYQDLMSRLKHVEVSKDVVATICVRPS